MKEVRFFYSEKPSEESTTSTSTPASTKAGTRSLKSRLLIPAPTISFLWLSSNSLGFSI